jgi:Txe/YoeB family toxin of Txe-Axe toxin-antitoxin module
MLISFDQSYWSRVNAGDRFVFAVDGSDEKRGVVLDKIYPQADKNSRKITAEARVDGLKVGLFGDGFIEVK